MIRWIVGSSLKFRYIVVAIAAALLFFGIEQVPNTPVDVFPEFAPPRVEIQTPCLGLTAQEVESLVSVPLEQAFNGIEGLDIMRSKSIPDLSSIELLFKPGTDEIRARQLVQERLATVIGTLPTWAAPPVIMPPVSSTSRVMKIGLSSKNISLMDMSMISYWTIRARLLGVHGVANVLIWGERIKIPQVRIDPKRMQANKVSVDDVMEVTADALDVGILQFSNGAVIGTGGFIDTPNQRLSVSPTSSIRSAEDLAQVTFDNKKKPDGTPLQLRDVADVVEDTWPLIGDAVINDGPGLMLIVQKYPWANTLDVTNGVEAAINEMRPGLPGLEIDTTIFRPATFIEQAISNLTDSLMVGAILVVIILLLFLWDWRIAMISLVIIPVSLMIALVVLNSRGSTLNVMVLAGLSIAIGAVVDDAIVDVENIVRRFRQLRKEGSQIPISRIVLDASIEVRGAIVYASLIEISALLPIFFVDGVSGAFFRPLATAYVVAGLVSPLVALTVTPALMLILLGGKGEHEERISPLLPWLHRGYEWLLQPIIHRPRVAFATVGLMVGAGLAVLPFLGESLFPEFKERDFLMHWITKPGTSVIEERRIVTKASHELRAIPGVRNFGSHIGQALLAEETVGVNFGENWISIDSNADYESTLAAIQETVDSYPGLFHNVETYLNERIDEVLSGNSNSLVVRIYGPDLKGIHNKADEIKSALSKIPGIVDLNVQLQSEVPQVQVEVDLSEAQRYGLKPGDVRRAAATLMSGEEVGDLFRDGKAYDVNVWSTPQTRASLSTLRDLPIDIPGGGYVRLGDVAKVTVAPAQSVIYRENDSRRIDVGANVRGRDIGAVANDLQAALQKIELPLGYHTELLGEYTERQAAQSNILLAGAVAVIAIFFLLQTSFRNFHLANLTFLTLPWALVGGVIAAYLAGGIISLGSLVGFLTILGIATRNGIMMISHFQHLEEDEGVAFGPELVIRGARERLAPIMMTALTTGLALVPLVLAGDIPGQEIEYPMAVVILGGLFTSTLLNVFLVPTLYLRFAKGWNFRPKAEA
jgi:CzcA family heavy metal efflux pump